VDQRRPKQNYVWSPADDRHMTFGAAGDTPVVFVRP
jgi:hypothetical protein